MTHPICRGCGLPMLPEQPAHGAMWNEDGSGMHWECTETGRLPEGGTLVQQAAIDLVKMQETAERAMKTLDELRRRTRR